MADNTKTRLDPSHRHITEDGKPTKDFFNFLKNVATTGSVDELFNKTLKDPSNVLGGVTVQINGDALGDTWYRNASGLFTRLPIGANGQVMTVAGGLPSWATPAAPPAQTIVLLNTLVAAGVSSVQDTTSITAAYDSYLVILENLVPASNSQIGQLQFRVGGTFQAIGYLNGGTSTTFIQLSANASNLVENADPGLFGSFLITNANSTTQRAACSGSLGYANTASGGGIFFNVCGWYNTAGQPVTGIKIGFTGFSSIFSGKVKIYGIVG